MGDQLPALFMALAALQLIIAAAQPVKLIIDTDIGGGGCNDVDDVVAICIAHALEQRGEAELLAIVQDTAPLKCAGVIGVLNHWYQRSDLPIGAYNIDTAGATLELEKPLPYVEELVDNWPSPVNNSSQVPDAVAIYRRTLKAQPDRSVTISSIGIHTNLAALLRSTPDEHSKLHGLELVRRKVRQLTVMGGKFGGMHGRHSGGPACNLCGGARNENNRATASAAAGYVAANWPPESKLIWLGFEVGVMVQSGGAGFQRCSVAADCRTTPWTPSCDPCAAAMVTYEKGANRSRFSWDPLTTLVAVRGPTAASTAECTGCASARGCCDGHNFVDPLTGNNTWMLGAKTNQSFLILQDAKKAGNAIDELLCQPPHRKGE
eukprot:3185830-Prymnesium_polylepis.1